MNINLSIRQKIQTYILGTVILVYLIVFGFISFSNRKTAFDQTARMIDSYAQQYAGQIESDLNSDMALLRTLANSTELDHLYSGNQLLEVKNAMIRNVFKHNPQIYSLWDSWEYSYLKPGWDKPYGRSAFTIWNENGTTKESVTERSLDGDPEIYARQKALIKENAFEPYKDVYADGKAEAKMMSSLAVPMTRGGKFIGIMAEDITLDQFQSVLESIKPFDDANAMLISQNGTIAGYPDKRMLDKSVLSLLGEEASKKGLADSLAAGSRISFTLEDSTGTMQYYAFAPIHIGRDGASVWSLGISVPVKTIYAQTNKSFFFSILVGLAGLLIIWFVALLLSKSITEPMKKITGLLNRMSKGELSADMRVSLTTKDEIADMGEAINRTLDGLIQKEKFCAHIGKGLLDSELSLISDDDQLGKSLLEMRNDLKRAKDDDDRRKVFDERRRWFAESLASINETIRRFSNDVDQLCHNLIKQIVLAVDANQGGVFLLNESDPMDVQYELKAAFAYNRYKLLNKSFRVGEGLLGACVAEKEEVYLRELPSEYIEITSGLGGANPRNLLIVPFIHEGKVLGVIELASFSTIEDHQKDLVLKVAESVASAISFAQTNAITQQLLEQSKIQAEMMSAQEEEMRQNLEELRSTQEEAQRRHNEMDGILEAFGKSVMWAEFDLAGNAASMSEALLNKLGLSHDKLVGINAFKDIESDASAGFSMLWESVKAGNVKRTTVRRKVGGKVLVFDEMLSPIYFSGSIVKILKVSYDVTEYKVNV